MIKKLITATIKADGFFMVGNSNGFDIEQSIKWALKKYKKINVKLYELYNI